MSSSGGSGFRSEGIGSHGEDRDRHGQPETQDNGNQGNLSENMNQGLLEYDEAISAPENELDANIDDGFFADTFLEGSYLHASDEPIGQDEGLDAYSLSTDNGSALVDDDFNSAPPDFLQQPDMGYAEPESASKPTNPYPSFTQEQNSSLIGNDSAMGSQGNTFGGAFNDPFGYSTLNTANYPMHRSTELQHSIPEPSNFASHAYRHPMTFGSAINFQAPHNQSGSALPSSMSTYWNLQDPNTFVENNTTTYGFAPPQSITPYGQSIGPKTDQFSRIQHRDQSMLRPERPIDPLSEFKAPSSATSYAGQENTAVKPITSEHDLIDAVQEHRVKEWRLSDYPHGNQEAQISLVREIVDAFRNLEGCLDNWKVLASYNATYSDRQIEIAAWQIMLKTRDAQEDGAIVRNWADSSKPDYEVYEDFSDRMLVVIENLKRSKAFCKSALAVSFMSRAVDRPGAELARKEINKKLNKAKTEQCKRGKEVTDADVLKIKQEKEAGEDKEWLIYGRGRKRQRDSDGEVEEEEEETQDGKKNHVFGRRQTRKRSKREEDSADNNNTDMSRIPAFQRHGTD